MLLCVCGMGHYDIASKHLVQRWPEAILKVVFPRSRVQFVEHGPTELPEVKRFTDRVMRVRKGKREVLLHLEVQTEWDDDVPARVANYRTRLRFGLRQAVSSVVLCLAPPSKPGRIVDRFVEGTGSDRIEVRFRVVKLWERSYSWDTLRRCPGLVPLAALSESTEARDLERLNRIIEEAPLAYEDKLDLQAIFGVMAGLRGFPDAMLRAILKEDMVHEHPILKEWEERARAQGLEQGLEQGRTEGELHLIRRLLAKLGVELESDLDAKLSQAGPEVLEQIADDLVGGDRPGVAELVRRRLESCSPLPTPEHR